MTLAESDGWAIYVVPDYWFLLHAMASTATVLRASFATEVRDVQRHFECCLHTNDGYRDTARPEKLYK